MTETDETHSHRYSEQSFRSKLTGHARTAGEAVVERALQLHYALEKPELPAWARSAIVGALGYFIVPIDAVPDIIPGAGYVDDLGVLALAFATVASHIDDEVRAKAKARVNRWFGPKTSNQATTAPE